MTFGSVPVGFASEDWDAETNPEGAVFIDELRLADES